MATPLVTMVRRGLSSRYNTRVGTSQIGRLSHQLASFGRFRKFCPNAMAQCHPNGPDDRLSQPQCRAKTGPSYAELPGMIHSVIRHYLLRFVR